MSKRMHLKNVQIADSRKFGAFLLGRAAGAGVPEPSDPERAALGRDAEGRVIAEFKGRVLARGAFDNKTNMPCIDIMDNVPDRFHEKIIKMFEGAYVEWHAHVNADMIERVKAKVREMLDPPANGAPSVKLDSITRADIEELSLKDVLREVLPEGVELVKFVRDDEVIRVYYEMKESGVHVPLLTVQNKDNQTILRSGDGKEPAPVRFFHKILEDAKEYNRKLSGPERLRTLQAQITKDIKDPKVTEAFIEHLKTSDRPVEYDLSPEVQIALIPEKQSVFVYIDRKIIAQDKPGSKEKMWVRPGYGWSPRAVFAQTALVEAGRRMIAENVIGREWEKDLEAGLE